MLPKLKILIVGGYGNVGSKVISILDTTNFFKITIAGLNVEKAAKFVKDLSDNVSFCYFDALKYPDSISNIDNNDIIISCIDLPNEKLAKYIIENGKVYIDFTANYEYINKIELLNHIAIEKKGLAVLSVGLVPGLSNLMIKHLQQENIDKRKFEKAETFVQLGLGDTNGNAAVQWTLNNMDKEYIVKNKNQDFLYKPLIKGKYEYIFGKKVLFYPFNFSDQHVICNTLNINKAISYLGFDSNSLTIFLSFLKRIRFFKLLKVKFINNIVLRIFTTLKLGSDLFTLKVKLYSLKRKTISLSVSGSNESLVTAQVACVLLKWINDNRNELPIGIKHIEQILEYPHVIKEITIKKQEITEFKTLV